MTPSFTSVLLEAIKKAKTMALEELSLEVQCTRFVNDFVFSFLYTYTLYMSFVNYFFATITAQTCCTAS